MFMVYNCIFSDCLHCVLFLTISVFNQVHFSKGTLADTLQQLEIFKYSEIIRVSGINCAASSWFFSANFIVESKLFPTSVWSIWGLWRSGYICSLSFIVIRDLKLNICEVFFRGMIILNASTVRHFERIFNMIYHYIFRESLFNVIFLSKFVDLFFVQ